METTLARIWTVDVVTVIKSCFTYSKYHPFISATVCLGVMPPPPSCIFCHDAVLDIRFGVQ